MTSVLSTACHCGLIASGPAPDLAEVPTLTGALQARGWVYSAHGFACCSEACAADRDAAPVTVKPPRSCRAPEKTSDLFAAEGVRI